MWRYYACFMADERIYLSPPDMSEAERAYLVEAFDSNWIAPVGPDLNAFEDTLGNLTGRAHVAALSSWDRTTKAPGRSNGGTCARAASRGNHRGTGPDWITSPSWAS